MRRLLACCGGRIELGYGLGRGVERSGCLRHLLSFDGGRLGFGFLLLHFALARLRLGFTLCVELARVHGGGDDLLRLFELVVVKCLCARHLKHAAHVQYDEYSRGNAERAEHDYNRAPPRQTALYKLGLGHGYAENPRVFERGVVVRTVDRDGQYVRARGKVAERAHAVVGVENDIGIGGRIAHNHARRTEMRSSHELVGNRVVLAHNPRRDCRGFVPIVSRFGNAELHGCGRERAVIIGSAHRRREVVQSRVELGKRRRYVVGNDAVGRDKRRQAADYVLARRVGGNCEAHGVVLVRVTRLRLDNVKRFIVAAVIPLHNVRRYVPRIVGDKHVEPHGVRLYRSVVYGLLDARGKIVSARIELVEYRGKLRADAPVGNDKLAQPLDNLGRAAVVGHGIDNGHAVVQKLRRRLESVDTVDKRAVMPSDCRGRAANSPIVLRDGNGICADGHNLAAVVAQPRNYKVGLAHVGGAAAYGVIDPAHELSAVERNGKLGHVIRRAVVFDGRIRTVFKLPRERAAVVLLDIERQNLQNILGIKLGVNRVVVGDGRAALPPMRVRAVRGDVVLGHVRRNNVNARVQIVDNRFEQPAVVIVRYGLADIGGRLAVDGRHLVIFNVRACVELSRKLANRIVVRRELKYNRVAVLGSGHDDIAVPAVHDIGGDSVERAVVGRAQSVNANDGLGKRGVVCKSPSCRDRPERRRSRNRGDGDNGSKPSPVNVLPVFHN